MGQARGFVDLGQRTSVVILAEGPKEARACEAVHEMRRSASQSGGREEQRLGELRRCGRDV